MSHGGHGGPGVVETDKLISKRGSRLYITLHRGRSVASGVPWRWNSAECPFLLPRIGRKQLGARNWWLLESLRRADLKKYLRSYGCQLYREGGKHSVWWNPANPEINDYTVGGICRSL
jgi:hypothetical protein